MGYYINPPNSSKEQFLKEKGIVIFEVSAGNYLNDETMPVCLVNNGGFTAAAIGYSQSEINCFKQPDGRPKIWYAVKRSDLAPYL
jgi:hypothetical protein